MKLVLPMAGFGSRLRPHTWTTPKPLVNVAGVPMIKKILAPFDDTHIDEFICIVGHLREPLEEYMRANYDVPMQFVVQDELLGQAHAIHLCKEYLDGSCLVLFADTVFDADLSGLEASGDDGIVYVREVEDPRRFGVVSLDDGGRITKFVEKPESMDNRLAVIGLYYIRDSQAMIRAIEDLMERRMMTKGEFYIADAYQLMIESGAKFTTREVGLWLDAGKPETVLETNRYLLDNGHDNTTDLKPDGKYLVVPPVFVDPTAEVENSVIGPHAVVAAGSSVKDSIIRNSIVMEKASVVNTLVEGSLVGKNATLKGRFGTYNIGETASVGEDYTQP